MPDAGPPSSQAIAWSPSPVLPKKRMSFADVGYEEMLQRARKLKPHDQPGQSLRQRQAETLDVPRRDQGEYTQMPLVGVKRTYASPELLE